MGYLLIVNWCKCLKNFEYLLRLCAFLLLFCFLGLIILWLDEWSLQCTEEAHRPVDCGTVGKWILKNSAESENMNWYEIIRVLSWKI